MRNRPIKSLAPARLWPTYQYAQTHLIVGSNALSLLPLSFSELRIEIMIPPKYLENILYISEVWVRRHGRSYFSCSVRYVAFLSCRST